MTMAAPPTRVSLPVEGDHDSAPGTSVLGVGVIVWLASELMFFAGLFAAYFTLRSSNSVWPPDDVELPVARTAVATVVLVASSGTIHMAVHAAREAQRQRALLWVGLTGFLGMLFIGNQALEYSEATFTMGDHAYGSIFYLLTGFHGLHVLGGLVLMAVVAGAVAASRVPAARSLEAVGYYWHFVDVVWVGLFVIVYLVR